MENYNIYKNIAERTQGDIYVGVVGPVRTGKSTFIKRFMDLLVIPNIENSFQRERARDELPQSGTGRTIMTTEPKFVPNEAVEITLDTNVKMKVRLIDCVGYIVEGAIGYYEENAPRMVTTPWFDYRIPFEEAAEIGTSKVINDHSTIGVMVTTDGTITDLMREEYVEVEKRVVNELKAINKPFVIVLNSVHPLDSNTMMLRDELEMKYSVPVIAMNCEYLTMEDINNMMDKLLFEFPICEIGVDVPSWVEALDDGHEIKEKMMNAIKETFVDVKKVREVKSRVAKFEQYEFIQKAYVDNINLGDGKILVAINMPNYLFFKVLSEAAGIEIDGEYKLMSFVKELARVKVKYDRIEFALNEVSIKGYGIVAPDISELTLEEPEIIKHGSRFGVRLRASAPSIHMIRCDVETEIAPLVGTEKQSEELVNYLLSEFESDPAKIWESNIFGKSLHELVNEGLHNKLFRMPEDAQKKLQETLQKIINEGSGGLICIIL